MEKATPAATATPTSCLGGDWFDPLEEAVRGQVRAFIEQLLEEELQTALGRGRYERGLAAKGHRNGHRDRRLATTFGPLVLAVPRARLADDLGEREWKSELLPAYRRLSRRAELLIAQVYLAARTRSAAPGARRARPGRPGSSAIWPMKRSCG
jgi:putative transposase